MTNIEDIIRIKQDFFPLTENARHTVNSNNLIRISKKSSASVGKKYREYEATNGMILLVPEGGEDDS